MVQNLVPTCCAFLLDQKFRCPLVRPRQIWWMSDLDSNQFDPRAGLALHLHECGEFTRFLALYKLKRPSQISSSLQLVRRKHPVVCHSLPYPNSEAIWGAAGSFLFTASEVFGRSSTVLCRKFRQTSGCHAGSSQDSAGMSSPQMEGASVASLLAISPMGEHVARPPPCPSLFSGLVLALAWKLPAAIRPPSTCFFGARTSRLSSVWIACSSWWSMWFYVHLCVCECCVLIYISWIRVICRVHILYSMQAVSCLILPRDIKKKQVSLNRLFFNPTFLTSSSFHRCLQAVQRMVITGSWLLSSWLWKPLKDWMYTWTKRAFDLCQRQGSTVVPLEPLWKPWELNMSTRLLFRDLRCDGDLQVYAKRK